MYLKKALSKESSNNIMDKGQKGKKNFMSDEYWLSIIFLS